MTDRHFPSQVVLLLVADDDVRRGSLTQQFGELGYHVVDAANESSALQRLDQWHFDVALLALGPVTIVGNALLEQIKRCQPECEVVLHASDTRIEAAVQAMKLGAFDYLASACSRDALERAVEQAAQRRQLIQENTRLKQVLQRTQVLTDMVGESPPMQELLRLIDRAGPTGKPVLILGESGSGKELVARALHSRSPRADRPLVIINCAALAESLLDSELFGHEKGAFTDALTAKSGLLELADGGTLLIDEIGEMSPLLQAKLLRVLEDGSLRRVGSTQERRVDVRLLAATHRDLNTEVHCGRFREDLYYRINLLTLHVPPLRDRAGDVQLLIRRYLGPRWQIEPAALMAMQRYSWPGNVRQLINVLERAKILANDGQIEVTHLPRELLSPPANDEHHKSVSTVMSGNDVSLAAVERAHVLEVLQRERGNKSRAARVLGVNRRSLYRLLERFDIEPPAASNPTPGPTA